MAECFRRYSFIDIVYDCAIHQRISPNLTGGMDTLGTDSLSFRVQLLGSITYPIPRPLPRSIREGECRSFRNGGFAVILTFIAEVSSSQNPQAGVKPLIIGQALKVVFILRVLQ